MSSGVRKSLIAAAVCLVVAMPLAYMQIESGRWSRMKDRVAALIAESRGRKEPRTVLRGEPTPGRSWDEYGPALQEAAKLTAEMDALNAFVGSRRRKEPATREKAEKLLAAHPGVIEGLRRGAQRADGQYAYAWEDGDAMNFPRFAGVRMTALLAAAQARLWAESGRLRDAAELLADTGMFGRDLGANGSLLPHALAITVYSIVSDEARSLITSANRGDLAEFAKELEKLDQDFPRLSPSFENERLSIGSLKASSVSGVVHIGLRNGFSGASVVLEAFDETDRTMERCRHFDEMTFAAAAKVAAEVNAERTASKNPLVQVVSFDVVRAVTAHRRALARIRLLRTAVTYLSTGEAPVLKDPFGDNLLQSKADGKLKIWSVGSDGKNQDGHGNWDSKEDENLVIEAPLTTPQARS